MTDPVISGQANTQQTQGLNDMRTTLGTSSGTPTFNTSSNSKTYFVAFDGTWNNRNDPSYGPQTNVSLLDQLATANGVTSQYYQGVGTYGVAPLSWLDAGIGATISSTARDATDDFQKWARAQFEANPSVKIDLAGASFSRGTITHTVFLNNVYNEGVGKVGYEIYGTDPVSGQQVITGYREGGYWILPKSDNLGTHLMMDRVAGPINMVGDAGTKLPPAANLSVTHLRAQNENRTEFASESLKNSDGTIDSRFTEIDGLQAANDMAWRAAA